MKKVVFILMGILMALSLLSGCTSGDSGQGVEGFKELAYEDISDEIIRFHVIANSDTEEDQNLKLKVRDNVIKYISTKLEGISSLKEAREVIIGNRDKIEEISKETIKENGYDYEVKTTLSRENFPDKNYGELFFPQGEYEAFRILIGAATGQNWWCVMFPPLCFVDEATSAINSDETKENFKKVIDEKMKGSEKVEPSNKKKDIKFKLKVFEAFKRD